jgi:hypothetical protein
MNKITPLSKAAAPSAPKHAAPKEYEHHWKHDGAVHPHAPKWAKYRTDMASEFPLPYRGGKDPLAEEIGKFVAKLDMLRPEKGGPAYLGDSGALTWTYPEVKDVKINQEKGSLDGVLDEVVKMFNGLGNWGSPPDHVQRVAAGQYRGDHGLDDGAGVRAEPDRRRIFVERAARRA